MTTSALPCVPLARPATLRIPREQRRAPLVEKGTVAARRRAAVPLARVANTAPPRPPLPVPPVNLAGSTPSQQPRCARHAPGGLTRHPQLCARIALRARTVAQALHPALHAPLATSAQPPHPCAAVARQVISAPRPQKQSAPRARRANTRLLAPLQLAIPARLARIPTRPRQPTVLPPPPVIS